MILYDCMHTQDYPVVHVNPTESRKSQIHEEVYNLWHNGVPFLTALWIKQYSTQLFKGVSVIPTCCFTARSDNCNAKDWKLCKPFAFKVHGSAAEPCGIFVRVGMEVIGIDFFCWLKADLKICISPASWKIRKICLKRQAAPRQQGNKQTTPQAMGALSQAAGTLEGWGSVWLAYVRYVSISDLPFSFFWLKRMFYNLVYTKK